MCVDVQASPFSVYYHCFLRCVDVQASVTAVGYNKEVLSWMMLIIFVYKRGYINNVCTSFPFCSNGTTHIAQFVATQKPEMADGSSRG